MCAKNSTWNRLKAHLSLWSHSYDHTDWSLLAGLEQGIIPVQKNKLDICLHIHSETARYVLEEITHDVLHSDDMAHNPNINKEYLNLSNNLCFYST